VRTGTDQNLGIAWDSALSVISLATSNDAGTAAIPLECKASAIYLMGGPVGVGNTAALPDGAVGNSHLIVGSTTAIGEITVSTNTASTAQAPVGYFNFANYNLAAAEKRIATIGAVTDGALNSGTVTFSTASSGVLAEHMRVTSKGYTGIGTVVPGYSLDIVAPAPDTVCLRVEGAGAGTSNNTQLRFAGKTSGSDLWAIGTDVAAGNGSQDFHFYSLVQPAPRVTFGQSGNVGLQGNTAPNYPLAFAASLGDKISLWDSGSGTAYGFGIQSGVLQIYSQSSATRVAIGAGTSASLTEVMSILGSNRVGVGTTGPASQLHISGAGQTNVNFDPINSVGGTLFVQDNQGGYGNGGTILLGASYNRPFAAIKSYVTNGGAYSAGWLLFNIRKNINDPNVYEAMRIQDSGNVGINCNNPVDLCTIAGLGAYGQLRLVYGNYGFFFRNDGGTLYMMTTSSGSPYGSWKAPYPITIDLATNVVGIRNGPNASFGLNVDSVNSGGYYLNGSPLSTGQPQTPWASAIDGNGQNLNHAGNVQAVSYSIYYGSGQNVPGTSGFFYDTTGRRIQVINGLITGGMSPT
jgi:hypothetical protein